MQASEGSTFKACHIARIPAASQLAPTVAGATRPPALVQRVGHLLLLHGVLSQNVLQRGLSYLMLLPAPPLFSPRPPGANALAVELSMAASNLCTAAFSYLMLPCRRQRGLLHHPVQAAVATVVMRLPSLTSCCSAGANAGFSTILFKLLWPEATVVMLEPDPSNFAILSRNVATCAPLLACKSACKQLICWPLLVGLQRAHRCLLAILLASGRFAGPCVCASGGVCA